MRALIQRVRQASVSVAGEEISHIGHGLLVLLGVEDADTHQDMECLAGKKCRQRVFDDANGVMNVDVSGVGGEVMVVSQFTLMASTRKGNRPSYVRAAPEPVSRPMYEAFVKMLEKMLSKRVATGRFGADMQVQLVNDGPVTIWMDSKNRE